MPINSSRRSAGDTAARCIIDGEISNGVTWVEDVEITEDGTAIAGTPTSWTWTLTLREDYNTSAIFTATTSNYLTITQGTDSTTLAIRVPKASIADLKGEYIIDLKSLDGSDLTADSAGLSKHWGHGIVTVRNEPV